MNENWYQRYINDPFAQWAALEASMEPTRRLMEELQRSRRQMEAMVDATRFTVSRELIEAAEERARWQETIVAQLRTQFEGPVALLMREVGRQGAVWEHLLDSGKGLERALEAMRYDAPFLAWQASLSQVAGRMDALHLPESHPALVRRLVHPFAAFSAFVDDTARLETTSSAMTTALQDTGEDLLACGEVLEQLLVVPRDTVRPSPVRALVAPYVQLAELQAAAEGEGALGPTPARVVADLGRQVLVKLARCNELCELREEERIFRPTTRMLVAAGDLVGLCPTDKRSFFEFIDGMYFLIYEGAGAANFRLLRERGGVLEPAECEVVWRVKRLRTWARHDLEHGSPAEVRKKWQKLEADFTALGVGRPPRDEREYRMFQRRLLEELNVLLDRLLERMEGSEG